MILKKADANLNNLKELYIRAFPESERKPFDLMEKNADNGSMEILSLEKEDGEFLGLVITILYEDKVLIDYFAVDESKRNGGIGGKALKLISDRYKDSKIFLEIETPDEKAENNAQRVSRKAFYLRNGMKESGIHADIYDTDMELLIFDNPVTFDEYVAVYKAAIDEEQLKRMGIPKQI